MWSGACRGGAQAVVGARAESLEGWASCPHLTPGRQGPRKRSGNGTGLFSRARPQPLSAVPALLEQTVRQQLPLHLSCGPWAARTWRSALQGRIRGFLPPDPRVILHSGTAQVTGLSGEASLVPSSSDE